MNAQKARELAGSMDKTESGNQYRKIISLIKGEAKKGNYEMFFYDTIMPDAKKKLIADGYKIGATQWDRNEPLTKITWYS